MLKLIGAFIIVFSSLVLSAVPLFAIKQKIIILQEFIHDFHYMHIELQTNLSSVPCLLEFLSEKGGVSTRKIYQSLKTSLLSHPIALFSEYWTKAFACFGAILSPEAIQSITHLGNILGRYTLEEQLSEIERCITCLEEECSREKINYIAKQKLYIGVGGTIAMITVILLA